MVLITIFISGILFFRQRIHHCWAHDGRIIPLCVVVVHVQPVCFHKFLAAIFVRLQACAVSRLVFPRQAAGVVAGALYSHGAVAGGLPHFADVTQVVAAVVVIVAILVHVAFRGEEFVGACLLAVICQKTICSCCMAIAMKKRNKREIYLTAKSAEAAKDNGRQSTVNSQ